MRFQAQDVCLRLQAKENLELRQRLVSEGITHHSGRHPGEASTWDDPLGHDNAALMEHLQESQTQHAHTSQRLKQAMEDVQIAVSFVLVGSV